MFTSAVSPPAEPAPAESHVVTDDAGERIDIRPVGMLAQSFDHRAVDGAYSGAYLRLVKQILESREWMCEFMS